MPRRPLLETVALNAKVPRGRDGIWSVIRDLDIASGEWTITDVHERTNVPRQTVRDVVLPLVRGGYAEVVRTEKHPKSSTPSAVYRLTERPAEAPRLRRDGTALAPLQTEAIWRSIRMAKTFTDAELSGLAEADARTVERYVGELKSAGVLVAVEPGGPGKPARWRLLRDLGPRAPKILRAHIVFDPNAGAVIGTPVAREVAP